MSTSVSLHQHSRSWFTECQREQNKHPAAMISSRPFDKKSVPGRTTWMQLNFYHRYSWKIFFLGSLKGLFFTPQHATLVEFVHVPTVYFTVVFW